VHLPFLFLVKFSPYSGRLSKHAESSGSCAAVIFYPDRVGAFIFALKGVAHIGLGCFGAAVACLIK
jgi:hypothetical protein